jgi:hypothetical protein
MKQVPVNVVELEEKQVAMPAVELVERLVPQGELRIGGRVIIIGLRGRPELNDTSGILEAWVESRQRWEVRLDSMLPSAAPLGLKAVNLVAIEDYPGLETDLKHDLVYDIIAALSTRRLRWVDLLEVASLAEHEGLTWTDCVEAVDRWCSHQTLDVNYEQKRVRFLADPFLEREAFAKF